jgi:hypothetical protein
LPIELPQVELRVALVSYITSQGTVVFKGDGRCRHASLVPCSIYNVLKKTCPMRISFLPDGISLCKPRSFDPILCDSQIVIVWGSIFTTLSTTMSLHDKHIPYQQLVNHKNTRTRLASLQSTVLVGKGKQRLKSPSPNLVGNSQLIPSELLRVSRDSEPQTNHW